MPKKATPASKTSANKRATKSTATTPSDPKSKGTGRATSAVKKAPAKKKRATKKKATKTNSKKPKSFCSRGKTISLAFFPLQDCSSRWERVAGYKDLLL